jgi:hypothetical protein
MFIFITFLARVKFAKRKRLIAGFIGSCLTIVSLFCVLAGAIYIEDVWYEDYENQRYSYGAINYTALICALWGLALVVFHVIAICVAKKYEKDASVRHRYRSTVFQTSVPGMALKRKESPSSKHKTVAKEGDADAGADDHDDKLLEQAHPDDPEQANGDDDGDDDDNNKDRAEIEPSTDTFAMPTLKSGKTNKEFLSKSSEGPSYAYLCRVKLFETYGFCCCCSCCPCCCKDVKQDNIYTDTSRMHRIDQIKRSNWAWRFFDGFKLFLWYCISAFFLYLTIVNCGATSQQTIVRNNLTKAFEFLYPVDYQTGPMW